jgi:hypothetical protein
MVTVKQLERDFAPYKNRYGYFTAGGDVDHIPLFHGFYLLILDHYGLLSEAEIHKQRKLMSRLIHPQYPGILMPNPEIGKGGNWFSHDTHKAMFWISQRLGMSFAKDFLMHGRNHGHNWNPINPGEFHARGTYWRFPIMIAQAKIAAGESLNPFHWFWLNAELLLGATKGTTRVEKVTLPVFICKTVEPRVSVDIWRKSRLKVYPGGLGEVLQKWGGPWKDSPYVDHLWGVV